MPTYLVEAYMPLSKGNQTATEARLARASSELAHEGVRVEHRRTTYVPDDETCFYLFDAVSPVAVDDVCRRAGLGRVRIVGAVER